jgi:hypothetical protein
MKLVDIAGDASQSQRSRSFYERTFEDIETHERELFKEIEVLQSARQQLLRLKAQLPDAASRSCVFCGGESRDLSSVYENSDAFECLGNTALKLTNESSYRPVPAKWECQACGAFNINSPGDARTWSRENLPGPKSLSRQMLEAFPSAQQVALEEASHGTVWMFQVADVWYVLPGNGAQIVERLRLHWRLR